MAARTSLIIEFLTDVKGLNKGISQVNSKLEGVGKMATKLGGVLAGAFAVDAIKDYTVAAFQLGERAAGVERAFSRTGASLNQLRGATQGTVSDIDLMEKSVLAVKLGIDAAKLPQYFQFAAQTAAETGQSVDFLVESIVTGIGRKSTLIMDNLGIQMKGAAREGESFADTAERLMRELSGGNAELALSSTQKLGAAFDNLQLAIGRIITGGEAANPVLDGFGGMINRLTFELEKLFDVVPEVTMTYDELTAAVEEQRAKVEQYKKGLEVGLIPTTAETTKTLADMQNQLFTLNREKEAAFKKTNEYKSSLEQAAAAEAAWAERVRASTQAVVEQTHALENSDWILQSVNAELDANAKFQSIVDQQAKAVTAALEEQHGATINVSQGLQQMTIAADVAAQKTAELKDKLKDAAAQAINLFANLASGGKVSGGGIGSVLGGIIGSFIPGVGTAIGAAAGGLIGGLFDRRKNSQRGSYQRGTVGPSNWEWYDPAVHGPVSNERTSGVTVNVQANMIGSEEQLANEISRLLDRNTQSTNFAP